MQPGNIADTSARRLPLFAYTMYAFYFVLLYTTTTNSMQFGRLVLVAVEPDNPDYPNHQERLLRFIAVVIATVVCLFTYFSRQKSLHANSITAAGKVILLLAVMSAGGWYIKRHGAARDDWSIMGPVSSQGWTWTYGLLVVFFSYHGWDNATLVGNPFAMVAS
jgi:amino acid transporter